MPPKVEHDNDHDKEAEQKDREESLRAMYPMLQSALMCCIEAAYNKHNDSKIEECVRLFEQGNTIHRLNSPHDAVVEQLYEKRLPYSVEPVTFQISIEMNEQGYLVRVCPEDLPETFPTSELVKAIEEIDGQTLGLLYESFVLQPGKQNRNSLNIGYTMMCITPIVKPISQTAKKFAAVKAKNK